MLSCSQLQFRLMTPEAQHAAVRRLALRGWDAKTISAQTGMPEADVHSLLADAAIPAVFHPRFRLHGGTPCSHAS
jgi:hypothetical protein